jgi:hypothetical protein
MDVELLGSFAEWAPFQQPRQATLPQRIGAGLCPRPRPKRKTAVRQYQCDRGEQKNVDVSREGDPCGHTHDPNESEDGAEGEQHDLSRSGKL